MKEERLLDHGLVTCTSFRIWMLMDCERIPGKLQGELRFFGCSRCSQHFSCVKTARYGQIVFGIGSGGARGMP